jgi:hypothetical protein
MPGAPERVSATTAQSDIGTPGAVTDEAQPVARWLPWAVVLLAPLLGVLALRAPVVNALAYRDPYFYSGYGWTLRHHVEVFGWFYYSIRFTASLPIGWTTALFGPVGGYLVLRYVILAGTGALLYLCVRRFASVWVACASVLLLALSAFYMRMVLWDYTTFVELPLTIAAAATWHLGATRRSVLLTGLATGVLVATAVFSNPMAWLVIPSLYGVEAVAALRGRWPAVRTFIERSVLSLVGAAIVFVAGWLAYRVILGSLPAEQMVKPTLDFAKQNSTLSQPFQIPARDWLAHEPRVYAPVLMCLAMVVVCGRSLLANTIYARVGQFAIAYTLVVWAYRKLATSAIIETWWSYNLTAVTLCFGSAVLLHHLATRDRGPRAVVGAVLAGTLVTDLVVRSLNTKSLGLYDDVRSHLVVLVAVLLLAAAAAVTMRLVRSTAGRAVAAAAFAAIVTFVSLTPAGHIGVRRPGEFSPFPAHIELDGYAAAYKMNELITRDDQPDSRTLIWSTYAGLASIGWTNLPHQNGGIDDPEAPTPAPELTPVELGLLRYPTTRRVLLMAEDRNQVAPGLAALRRAGFRDARVEQQGTWVDGILHYSLIDLRGGAR